MPICAGLVWLLVVKGNYKSVEKIFLVASGFYICYIIAGVLARPSWHEALIATVQVPGRTSWRSSGYVYMVVATIGATIAPWMQFYLQASTVEKRIPVKKYAAAKWDVIVGSLFTDLVAWFIIVACAATLFAHGHGIPISVPGDAAEAMKPLAGKYAFLLFSFGLFNASFFAASVLPLSTAYTVCEGLGFESGVDRSFREAPFFYWLYTLLIAGGAAVVLLPNFPLIKITILSQVLNGLLLPIVILLMLLLINRKDLMGEYVNSRIFNVIAWATAIIVIGLSIVMMVQALKG